MQPGKFAITRTDPATQFTGALAQNAGANLNLLLPSYDALTQPKPYGNGTFNGGTGSGGVAEARLTDVLITSVENLDWEVSLWGNDLFNGAAIAASMPFGRVSLPGSGAWRIAASGLYYYHVGNLRIPYADFDRTGELHLQLVNRAASAKTAGANGAIQISLVFENTQGY